MVIRSARPGSAACLSLAVSPLPHCAAALLLLLHALVDPCHPHPQPCHILARIGHTVRVGALLPARRPARAQAALDRALAALGHGGGNQLPYNLSLEVLAREPAHGDPQSLFTCVCQTVVVRGVSAVLAFPQSREELLQVEFMASFLEIPFISVIERGEPLAIQSPQGQAGGEGLFWQAQRRAFNQSTFARKFREVI
ncbi:hypothetical protein AAFF_G00298080 [Aldrovandia affinis]|uniref:Uncharacterized protein n=1 Tax=Aldrovandia affinis TaxID=143900 RepID=A0AAD7W0J4_9TELE|nr:hypothetical protein AAFF_G00298080 [Aldrovandia affinis]